MRATPVRSPPTWAVPALSAFRVRGVTNPKAFSEPTVMQICRGGVYVVITRVTCSVDARVRGHGASSVLISY